MKEYGNIIFLNGLTSTGKTSIVKELISRKMHMFFVLTFDLFEQTIEELCEDPYEYYANDIISLYSAARIFSEQGCDVIIDGLIMNIAGLEQHYKELKNMFQGYPLKIIDVHCPMEICRKRNRMRRDRRENQSFEQSKIAETNIDYFLSIDTGQSSIQESVDLLVSKLELKRA